MHKNRYVYVFIKKMKISLAQYSNAVDKRRLSKRRGEHTNAYNKAQQTYNNSFDSCNVFMSIHPSGMMYIF